MKFAINFFFHNEGVVGGATGPSTKVDNALVHGALHVNVDKVHNISIFVACT